MLTIFATPTGVQGWRGASEARFYVGRYELHGSKNARRVMRPRPERSGRIELDPTADRNLP